VIDVFVFAVGIGLAFNAAPGAVSAESLRRGVAGGFRPAFAVQVGSLVGDAVWAVLGLAGVAALLAVPAVRVPVALAGCVVLARLGIQAVRAAVRPADGPVAPASTRRSALAAGASLSLGNPWNVVYWSGAAGAVTGVLGVDAGPVALGVFLAGFMVSSLAWCLVCAGAIALLRRALPPLAVRVVELGCGLALLAFAGVVLAGTAF